jgi:dCTP deaminase
MRVPVRAKPEGLAMRANGLFRSHRCTNPGNSKGPDVCIVVVITLAGRFIRLGPFPGPVAVLPDRDILKAIDAKRLRIGGFRPENLTPNGYDLTVAEVAIVATKPRTVQEGTARVPPQTRFAVATLEVVELGPDITAQLWLRTTWARKGVLASFGKVDAGFRGTLTLAAFNANRRGALEVKIGDRFAQIVFEDLASPAERVYGERSGHWQDQQGVRLR